jgi:hypothetical protein
MYVTSLLGHDNVMSTQLSSVISWRNDTLQVIGMKDFKDSEVGGRLISCPWRYIERLSGILFSGGEFRA